MNFNSKEYSYCDMQVTVMGRPITGLRGIEYSVKKNKEVIYGAGSMPHSVQHGKREYSGTLKVLQSELEALNKAAKTAGLRDLLDLQFDIIVTYESGGILITDKIRTASVTEFKKGMNEGDLNSEHDLAFVALNIQTNL